MKLLTTVNFGNNIYKTCKRNIIVAKTAFNGGKRIAFCCMCAGINGKHIKEVANILSSWFNVAVCRYDAILTDDSIVYNLWEKVLIDIDERLCFDDEPEGYYDNPSVLLMLIKEDQTYIMNVGNITAYSITTQAAEKLTQNSSNRSIEFKNFGNTCGEWIIHTTKKDEVFLILSTSCIQNTMRITVYNYLSPINLPDLLSMKMRLSGLLEGIKDKGDEKYVSAILLKVY